jgi:hypothetical protein
MNRARQRRLDARENRQESLHNRGNTVEPTVNKIQVPQPKNFPVKGIVKVKENVIQKNVSVNSPNVTVIEKRGRGRPKKLITDKNNKVEKSTKNLVKKSVKKSAKKSKEKR